MAPESTGLSPLFLAYLVAPLALVLLLVIRHFGFVAKVSPWAYVAALGAAGVSARLVERWANAPRGSVRLHARVVVHVCAVTVVIYMSGWGPTLGMAYAFSALADLQLSGAGVWRAALGWSLTGCATGQVLVVGGWAPSFLSVSQAATIGLLGAFVFGIAIRMAGAIGEHTEAAEAELARSEAHHRAVVENAAEGIYTVDLHGTIQSFNAAAEAMFGWTAAEIIGQPITILTPVELHDHLSSFLAAYESSGHAGLERNDIEIAGVRRDGSQFPMKAATNVILVDGAAPIVSCIARDLTDQKQVEAQLAYQASHDPLTGLPNRVMLTDRIEQALAWARQHGQMCGVLYVDLDKFKAVNDALGHAVGDQLLIEAVARIRDAARATDTLARLGGDEFVVLCEDLHTMHQATDIAQRIIAAVEAPFHFGDNDAHIGASIGIAVSRAGTETADTIMTNADTAMYRAKSNGRSCYELFDDAMQHWVRTQAALEADLRQAVSRNELRLYCQPIVDADTATIRGFEALVRWERPGFGLVPPDEFIPIAEETGLILDIRVWVLDQACRHAAAWALRWPDQHLSVAVNLSGASLLKGELVDAVVDVLTRTGLPPSRLTLELTETTLVEDATSAELLLHQLRQLGINLALDDFGTGYSSLTHLRSFPIDTVKIDKSFIRAIGTEREDTAIVAAIITLGKNLGIEVIAEGVENHEQLAVLLQLGCPYLQGYLFARPTPIQHAAELIAGPPLGRAPAPHLHP